MPAARSYFVISLLFSYFDFKTPKDIVVYGEKRTPFRDAPLVSQLGPLGILIQIIIRFKAVAKHVGAGGTLTPRVIDRDGGYIAMLTIVPAFFVIVARPLNAVVQEWLR